ncbi:MAG: 4-hydroxy-tetrahydrodipicolinate reductase [bacterium]
MLRIIVTGAKGRMGSRIAALVRESSDLSLAAGIDAGDSLDAALAAGADAVIDFTVAAAAVANAAIAAKARVPIVIGTTGMNDAQNAAIVEASRLIPVVQSSNMSIGVNVMWSIVEKTARSLGRGYAIDIEETHHVHKLDRPSGTAKTIAEFAGRGLGSHSPRIVSLIDDEPWERKAGDDSISVRSFRRDEVVGDHSISFTGPAERLTIQHHAKNRDLFAAGALTAARWIVGKSPGLYTMADVLGLK